MGCGEEPWPTYGHDAQRSFASAGCIDGQLTTTWRYVPAPPADQMVSQVFHAVSDGPSVYLTWRGKVGPYFGTPFLDKLGSDGKTVWQFTTGVDSSFGMWPCLALGQVMMNDDGLLYIDPASGKSTQSLGVDYWGQIAPGDGRVYVTNTVKVDGPGVFVGAYDAQAKQLWVQNQAAGDGQFNPINNADGVAVDGGTVFSTGNYAGNPPPPVANGVYAFDAATGEKKWAVATNPLGPPSAGSGKVFLGEGMAGMGKLVARNQSDGSVAWSAMPEGMAYNAGQPPVLAGDLVIVRGSASVVAYHVDSGALAWSTPASMGYYGFSGMSPGTTTLAAAKGSSTLVSLEVSSDFKPAVVVLDLATGAVKSTSVVPMAQGGLADPIIVGKRLYAADTQALYAIDAP